MSWLQLKLTVPGEFADELSDYCLELGAVSAVMDNAGADTLGEAVLEPGPGATIVWENAVITAFWPAHADLATLSSELARIIHDKAIFAEVKVNFIADSDLVTTVHQPVARLSFGAGRLWLIPRVAPAVVPADSEASTNPDGVPEGAAVIKLDPGLAFGSGLHPTTQLCLDYLARASERLSGARVLDFGCGSGVLALAALALGAAAADGVDHDPQALVATLDNAAYNDVGGTLQVFMPAELPDDAHYEVVVANILANPLIELAGQISSRVKAGGQLVMAGLLAEQASAVQAAYPQFNFEPPVSYLGSAIAQEIDAAFAQFAQEQAVKQERAGKKEAGAHEGAAHTIIGGVVASPDEDWVCLCGVKRPDGAKDQP